MNHAAVSAVWGEVMQNSDDSESVGVYVVESCAEGLV